MFQSLWCHYKEGGEGGLWRLTTLSGPLTKWVLTDWLDTTYHVMTYCEISRPSSTEYWRDCGEDWLEQQPKLTKTKQWCGALLPGISLSDFSGNISACKCGNMERQEITGPSLTFPETLGSLITQHSTERERATSTPHFRGVRSACLPGGDGVVL